MTGLGTFFGCTVLACPVLACSVLACPVLACYNGKVRRSDSPSRGNTNRSNLPLSCGRWFHCKRLGSLSRLGKDSCTNGPLTRNNGVDSPECKHHQSELADSQLQRLPLLYNILDHFIIALAFENRLTTGLAFARAFGCFSRRGRELL